MSDLQDEANELEELGDALNDLLNEPIPRTPPLDTNTQNEVENNTDDELAKIATIKGLINPADPNRQAPVTASTFTEYVSENKRLGGEVKTEANQNSPDEQYISDRVNAMKETTIAEIRDLAGIT